MLRMLSGLLLLAICTVLDLRYKKIWMPLILIFAAEAAILLLCKPNDLNQYLTGMTVGLFILVVSKATNGSIGMGDGYLICVLGALVGLSRIIQITLLAFGLAAIAAIFLILIWRYGRKQTMAFVPFLLIAYLIRLISW